MTSADLPSPGTASALDWYRSAVTYQLYIRSFADSDGDGLGDIGGIRSRVPYLASLGVDAIWINPWYPSPQADAGYDVADYRGIHPPFGDLAQAEALIHEAHAAGLKILLDIVPNHTSDEHPWFAAALAAGPGSAERERFVFRPGTGEHGELPPNDWQSVFGGPAWHRVPDGEWYLHLFDVKQPDLNWDNRQVRDEFESVLRFWFDLGADGFRIDVAHGLIKDPALPSLNLTEQQLLERVQVADHPYWDRPGVLEVWREWRAVGDSYDPPRVFVAEAWVESSARLAEYLRPDRLHTAFDFELMRARWNAKELRETARISLEAHDSVGAPVMWTLSNHDVTRHVTRLGRPQQRVGSGHSWPEGETDLALGTRRARAAILYVLALPGGVYLYQGEELGLPEVEDLPEELLQDPTWQRSGHTERGRDGCRVPIPWRRTGPSLGFGPGPGWLPQPSTWDELSVEAEEGDPGSMLSLYREALRLRRELPQLGAEGGPLVWTGEEESVVGLTRGSGFVCLLNTGAVAVPLPPGRVVLSSSPVEGGLLPPDATAWIVTD